jgi:hypothetical protein
VGRDPGTLAKTVTALVRMSGGSGRDELDRRGRSSRPLAGSTRQIADGLPPLPTPASATSSWSSTRSRWLRSRRLARPSSGCGLAEEDVDSETVPWRAYLAGLLVL